MILKRMAQRAAAAVAPRLHRAGGSGFADAGALWFSFLGGHGAGAGWDLENEIATAAGLIRSSAPVIFDVGANNGVWSAALSAHLGDPAARFFLFEVAPYCFPEIEARRSAIANCVTVRRAVSDRGGHATLHLPTEFSGLASLHARQDKGVRQREYRTQTVETITLDAFAADHGLTRIDLVKMDIEGHELAALRGAERLLAAREIAAITFEFGSANVNSRTFFRDYWELLMAHGYRIGRMIPGGGYVPVRRYTETLEYFRGATNYIATVGS